jgi:hypothetical protein
VSASAAGILLWWARSNGTGRPSSGVTDSGGTAWLLDYGVVTVPGHPTRIRDTVSGTSAPVLDGKYFVLAIRAVGRDRGDNIHLQAVDASGRTVAEGF